MNKLLLVSAMAFSLTALGDFTKTVIPQPNQVKLSEGSCTFDGKSLVLIGKTNKEFAQEVQNFGKRTGIEIKTSSRAKNGGLKVQEDKTLEVDAYKLVIDEKGIVVTASSSSGVFYALQTLTMMLPPEFAAKKEYNGQPIKLPAVSISDKPRFEWRAYMLDEGRYFFGKETVFRILDQMALLKMNIFHWHLTEDQGWRIEIKKYPKLTEVGSKRKDTQIGGWESPRRSGVPHGGFYTQEEIKEIVAYAAERHITIVPEIGMPGHATAAIAAYPELGSREPIVPVEVSVIYGKMEDAFNPANEKVYEFMSDVLDEVCELFPSKVIHIGGDEVRFDHWRKNSQVKALMEREGLKTMADVQIYFTNRMSKIIEAKGRRMMGWNEILGDDLHGFLPGQTASGNAKLSETAQIHFWKGSLDIAKRAINSGHDIVNSLHSSTYLDYGSISLHGAYMFDPMYKGLTAEQEKKVKGFGCQMWTEWQPTSKDVERMTFPRLAAYAEVGWTNLDQKDWKNFQERMKNVTKIWDYAGFNYAKDQVNVVTKEDFFNYNKIATWTPEQTPTNWGPLVVPVKLETVGIVEVAFVFERGQHAIDISEVQLLENGKVIATDKHTGFSGNKLSEVAYQLELKKLNKDSKYEIKAIIKGSAGTNSYGEIKMITK